MSSYVSIVVNVITSKRIRTELLLKLFNKHFSACRSDKLVTFVSTFTSRTPQNVVGTDTTISFLLAYSVRDLVD